jgi:pyruvate dehydrogenase E2 component (dihydrolipoamide acetyltransferase)
MIQIKMPEAGFSITEGTIVEWYKKEGERVHEGENVVCVETDKLTVDVPAEKEGILKEIKYGKGEVVPVNAVMGVIVENGKVAPQRETEGQHGEPAGEEKTVASDEIELKRISPAAKAVARSHGIDASLISKGSGPHGRIIKQDVLDFIHSEEKRIVHREEGAPVEQTQVAPGMGRAGVSKSTHEITEKRVEFKGWRKVIADRMTSSKREIPHYTMSVEADVTSLSQMIERIRERQSIHITYIPFMMKAIEIGVRSVPLVNAICDGSGFTMIDELNIGIAVDLGEKLLVPVVKAVGDKSILDLVKEIAEIVKKTREERLEPADVSDGTLTLTNVGMFQIHSATSVILQPQVSIVYMGEAREVPGVHNSCVEIRKKMIFGSTFDHRVVNGASGGRFLMKVKQCLEDTETLLTELR